MLEILFYWLVIFFYTFGIAHFISFFLSHSFYADIDKSLKVILGFSVINIYLAFFHFFIPVTHWLNYLVLGVLALIGWLKTWKIPKIKFNFSLRGIAIFSLLIYALKRSSETILNWDTGSYHLPTMVWYHLHPIVKGIVNIHSRYGFNYHYLINSTFFSFPTWAGHFVHALNGFLFVNVGFYFISKMTNNNAKSFDRILATFGLLGCVILTNGMTSFSPDFPIASIIFILLYDIVTKIFNQSKVNNQWMVLFGFLGTVALTLKLSAFMLLIFYVIVFNKKWFNFYILKSVLWLAIIPVTIYCIRNYFINGYLIYPFFQIDLFSVPWKIPMHLCIRENILVKNYALGIDLTTRHVSYSWSLIKHWFSYLPQLNKIYPYYILLLGGCVIFSIIIFFQKSMSKLRIVLLAYLVLVALWFYLAPDPRFEYGILNSFIALVLAVLTFKILNKPDLVVLSGVILLLFMAGSVFISNLMMSAKYDSTKVDINFVHQGEYPKIQKEVRLLHGHKVYYNQNYCWDCPPPCNFVEEFEMIDSNHIETGFIYKYHPF